MRHGPAGKRRWGGGRRPVGGRVGRAQDDRAACRYAGSQACGHTPVRMSEGPATGQKEDPPPCHKSMYSWMARADADTAVGTLGTPSFAQCDPCGAPVGQICRTTTNVQRSNECKRKVFWLLWRIGLTPHVFWAMPPQRTPAQGGVHVKHCGPDHLTDDAVVHAYIHLSSVFPHAAWHQRQCHIASQVALASGRKKADGCCTSNWGFSLHESGDCLFA